MSGKSDAPKRAPTVYAIPESAHVDLVQLRDHLRLMAELTAVGSNASKHDARLRPDAMAWWFSRLLKEIDGVLAVSTFSMELASAYDAAHRKPRSPAKA